MYSCALLILVLAQAVLAKVHTFYYNATWVTENPDGLYPRQVISFNGSTPLPTIEVNKGDEINFYLTNGLGNDNTSLHFHGLFQNGSSHMDGPEMVVQCPIAPGSTFLYNFTVPNQAGTYWYHSHSGMQYGDGLRGVFIVHDEEAESLYQFDEEMVWTVTDWFHLTSWELVETALSRYNPTGAEPIPDAVLFQNSRNVSVPVKTNTTYLIHLVNTGMFVSQYLYIPQHTFQVVELDGVFIKPNETEVVYISVGQRMSLLLTTKEDADENFSIVQVIDEEMLDLQPPELKLVESNWLVYDDVLAKPNVTEVDKDYLVANSYDDFYAHPINEAPLLESADVTIELSLEAQNLGDGVNYMMLNDKTYVAPKVPALYTALSAKRAGVANDISIYGSNTNSFLIQDGEIVDIILNNVDDGKHPFHLHGHNFQIVYKSPAYDDPVAFSYDNLGAARESVATRDTVLLESNGNLLLRFKADNPGVWFFHCHVDYHMAAQGLAVVLIESPSLIDLELTKNQLEVCSAAGISTEGNAAGHVENWSDLSGENVQHAPLPPGFTTKGYIAFFVCVVCGIYGLWTIKEYGMAELDQKSEEEVIENLKALLQENGVSVDVSATDLIDENTVLTDE